MEESKERERERGDWAAEREETGEQRERRLGATEGKDCGRERGYYGTKRGKTGGRKEGK